MLIIEDVGVKSARHFVQRRLVVGAEVKNDGAGGEEDAEVEAVDADCAELRRRRKGMLGRR